MYAQALRGAVQAFSLDEMNGADDSRTKGETFFSLHVSAFDRLDRKEMHKLIEEALDNAISPTHKDYIIEHYGLHGHDPRSYVEMGELNGCTSQNIQQNVARALKQMRAYIEPRM